MGQEVFDQTLGRVVEFNKVVVDLFGESIPTVNICGLGEPLLNKNTPKYAAQVRDAGFACQLISNASLLDEERGQALLDAGLQSVWLNVGEHDDDYNDIYKLPFEKTRENVVRFAEMAGGRCQVHIVLVDHRQDPDHLAEMKEFWGAYGLNDFLQFDVMNRGGTLFVDHMQYEAYPEQSEALELLQSAGDVPPCMVPYMFLFVGYDGQYYLCCSDWKKEVPLGSVFDTSFVGVMREKFRHIRSREPICKSCNHDPVNRITDLLRANGDGGSAAGAAASDMVDFWSDKMVELERLDPGVTQPVTDGKAPRRLIPLTSI
jgi:MoaA/NifB/PqqE/SkfB family radical SAM enzyme